MLHLLLVVPISSASSSGRATSLATVEDGLWKQHVLRKTATVATKQHRWNRNQRQSAIAFETSRFHQRQLDQSKRTLLAMVCLSPLKAAPPGNVVCECAVHPPSCPI